MRDEQNKKQFASLLKISQLLKEKAILLGIIDENFRNTTYDLSRGDPFNVVGSVNIHNEKQKVGYLLESKIPSKINLQTVVYKICYPDRWEWKLDKKTIESIELIPIDNYEPDYSEYLYLLHLRGYNFEYFEDVKFETWVNYARNFLTENPDEPGKIRWIDANMDYHRHSYYIKEVPIVELSHKEKEIAWNLKY
jgi:hypothetical protein